MADSFEQAERGFDRERYPIWRDRIAEASAYPRRSNLIEQMRRTRVFDLPGADIGW
jgi:hypothetical protein